ncbi:MAG TPA: hypothetical protein VN894_17690 [Polyangiaceae bacterium]|nr:hypothetical protein [Polyangiaceae bacterium]
MTAALAALFASSLAGIVRGGDPFEIQVYDGTANPAGVPGIELHVNDWATGHRESTAPEAPLHGQLHWTLEPSLGVTPYWELGAYLQMAVRTDAGVVDWAGVKLRSKLVMPPDWNPHWRLGVNLELSYLPETYDRSRWGSEVRPIVAWQNDLWLFVVNPILGQSLANPGASDGPSLEPAAKVWRSLGPIALGLEYYGTIGPALAPWPLRDQEHYIFEVIDLLHVESFELNMGIGEGLTAASAGIVVKAIIGYELETSAIRPTTPKARTP